MWPTRDAERRRVIETLEHHHQNVRAMPGIADRRALETLAQQFIASLRREDYHKLIQRKEIAASRADPNHSSFDAQRAIAYHMQKGHFDEACWLIFLMTHFARPADTGWLRLRDVYGMLGKGKWDWAAVSADVEPFRTWLDANWQRIRGKFGNHRKYSSLRPGADRTTTEVVASYIAWVGAEGHSRRFAEIVRQAGNDPHTIFETFYRNLNVLSFGRLGKFDYLALLGRYGLVPMEAGSAYLDGATGPLNGARLLFDGRSNGPSTTSTVQRHLDALAAELQVGMEVMEDALCNWQKSPCRFVHYIG